MKQGDAETLRAQRGDQKEMWSSWLLSWALCTAQGLLWGCTGTGPGPRPKRANSSHKTCFPPQIYDITEATPVFFYQNHSRHNNIKKDVLTLAGLRRNFQALVVHEMLPVRKAQPSPDTHPTSSGKRVFIEPIKLHTLLLVFHAFGERVT